MEKANEAENAKTPEEKAKFAFMNKILLTCALILI